MNKQAKKWVKFLKTNPKKYTTKLISFRDDKKRCCLGWALETLNTDLKKDKKYLDFYDYICHNYQYIGVYK